MQQERDRDTGWRERKTIYAQEGIRAEGKHLRKMDGHNLTDETGEAKLNMCTQQKTVRIKQIIKHKKHMRCSLSKYREQMEETDTRPRRHKMGASE